MKEKIKRFWWLTLFLFPIFFFPFLKKEESVEFDIQEKGEMVEVEEEKKLLKIDIKGAILNPGLYELEEGSRVEDAIKVSGGLLENTDTSRINLSKILFDEMVIIIYTKEEIQSLEKGTTAVKYIEKECICPSVKNDACIKIEEPINSSPDSSSPSKVSLNRATITELMTLSGIGEAKAKAIISYREEHGEFLEIHDITKVSGIGEATYEKIKDSLTL